MNMRTLGLITLLAVLLFITAKVMADVKAERIKINVSGTCIERVEKVAGNVEGVIQSHWDEEKKELEIIFEDKVTSLDKIEQTLSEAGFDTPNYRASEQALSKIANECKEEKTSGL